VTRDYCCQCGRKRKFTERQMHSYGANVGIIDVFKNGVEKHGTGDPLSPNEIHPTLLGNVCVFRNGGTDYERTHICARCLLAALRLLKAQVDRDIAALEESAQ
jgi:hypothetical protein